MEVYIRHFTTNGKELDSDVFSHRGTEAQRDGSNGVSLLRALVPLCEKLKIPIDYPLDPRFHHFLSKIQHITEFHSGQFQIGQQLL